MRTSIQELKGGSEPAFVVNDASQNQYTGLTKREYFAAMMMQAYLSNQPRDIAAQWGVEAADRLIYALNGYE